MLSKLALIVSWGRYLEASSGRSSRSRIAAVYSARFRRWKERRPGFGFAAALSSSWVSSDAATSVSVSSGGRRAPGGGIIPSRSFETIFSASTGFAGASPASKPASDMLPVFIRSLWQTMQ